MYVCVHGFVCMGVVYVYMFIHTHIQGEDEANQLSFDKDGKEERIYVALRALEKARVS